MFVICDRNLLYFLYPFGEFFCNRFIKIKKKHYLTQKLSTSLSYLKLNPQKLIFTNIKIIKIIKTSEPTENSE
jgi:hypothetical protein